MIAPPFHGPTPAPQGRSVLDRIVEWGIGRRSLAFQVGVALGAFLAAALLRLALDPVLPPGFPYLTFFPAVALTAVFAGTLVGLAVAIMGGLFAWYVLIAPAWSFALTTAGFVALLLYVIVMGTELTLVFLMRRALRRMMQAEARARSEAHMRSLMFAELQHRVSNNLAVVGSLLQLQRRAVADPAARRALETAAARLGVVSRLSRLLHDPAAQSLDLGAFLRAIVPEAVAAQGVEDRIALQVSVEPVVVPAAAAIPFGLIATELLANAIEHGFGPERSGRIAITLARTGRDAARLEIRDNGGGLPTGFDLQKADGLGLSVARQFAAQIGGTLAIREEEGEVVSRLDFPLRRPGAA
ncbi:sensor histidine kinase [Rubellimicrobium sp. CFH 75288]|uniref:sensor histidine kinase n=1 Tax=Rubellimicrobium sp. CFH 75288 TaxID=2697034 RepID=UPI001411FA44|nr:sensor histidine kinase [Rubellimicrobium sp. CFH 75288]NAZ37509.1 DUF4118 domain-containing protein [Rubellimicrobium sp. CFH 75288]